MAVANTKSTHITNADATPPVLTNSYVGKGRLFEAVGTVETLAADDAASVYRLVRVPSNARISSILLASDAITGASASDVGVYQTAQNGGAVVDADFFATDVDISTAATVFTEVMLEATATDIAKVEYRLWELLGLSADPMRDYDIAVTVNDVTAAGTISMKVKYTV
jgi:hypothetical protein